MQHAVPERGSAEEGVVTAVVQSSVTTLRVLEIVGERQPVSVAEVARVLGRPKSTAQRALVTLHDAGWIRPSGTDRTRWVLTARVLDVARHVADEDGLREVARPVLARLRQETGESVTLMVRDGAEAVSVEFLEGSHSVRFVKPVGVRNPLHAGANGKAILAHLPEDEIRAHVEAGLTPVTPRTVTVPRTLRAQLARIRRDGYAVSRGEATPDAGGTAAPIFDADGRVVASVAATAPLSRMTTDADAARLAAAVVAAARQITTGLATLAHAAGA
jgi:IclR family acetate operon transcriptional repressor